MTEFQRRRNASIIAVGRLNADPDVINELAAEVGGVGQNADSRGTYAKIVVTTKK